MVSLFASSKADLSEQIKHSLLFNELAEQATVRKFQTVQQEGNRLIERDCVHYNLDVIIAVGYRVNTTQGTKFRQWATQWLKDYLIQGYAIR